MKRWDEMILTGIEKALLRIKLLTHLKHKFTLRVPQVVLNSLTDELALFLLMAVYPQGC